MIDTSCLNDSVITRLADLFLYRLPVDKHGGTYRHIRSAVVLIATENCDAQTAYDAIALLESSDPVKIANDVRTAITDLGAPIDEIFNKHYSLGKIPFMPPQKDPDEAVAFLATTFMYILESNYSE